ncbi:MAG: S1 RNA-binding domain-containing protein [Spirochaetales bacterium]|nr:S1 RNA-binding domain-containing protein [Spirochaetales bacterium]
MVKTERFQPGQLVELTIEAITDENIFLQLGGKSEGVLDRAELNDEEGNLKVAAGDTIQVYFLEAKNGEMRFTTRLAGENAGTAMLESAWQNQIPVEGKVEKEIKGGYEIKIGDTRAFCPYSQMGLRRAEEGESFVGRRLTFLIQEYKDHGRSILVSNRVIEQEAQQTIIEELKKTLKEGQSIRGTIVRIQDFGAYVDIGGMQALLPISEISLERVTDITQVLSVGQEIEARILKLDWQANRMSLSRKALLADPWVNAATKYPVNSRHEGTVTRTADFGIFVALEPGLDGLLHVSELGGDGRRLDARKLAKVGDKMSVQILDVNVKDRRIALKPATSLEDEATQKRYLVEEVETERYNPFAAKLKRK